MSCLTSDLHSPRSRTFVHIALVEYDIHQLATNVFITNNYNAKEFIIITKLWKLLFFFLLCLRIVIFALLRTIEIYFWGQMNIILHILEKREWRFAFEYWRAQLIIMIIYVSELASGMNNLLGTNITAHQCSVVGDRADTSDIIKRMHVQIYILYLYHIIYAY